MVRAILDGRKTQTRRVILHRHAYKQSFEKMTSREIKDVRRMAAMLRQDEEGEAVEYLKKNCPYGQPGDRLWVRETWQHEDGSCDDHKCGQPTHIYHKATESFPESIRWRPSIFMPRWASRLTLQVEEVRIQRLKEISEEDAKAEGVKRGPCNCANWASCGCSLSSYRLAFSKLWESINAKRGFGWDKNPWVWVIEFNRVTD